MDKATIKKIFKRFLGHNAVYCLKILSSNYKYFKTRILHRKENICMYGTDWSEPIVIEKRDKHLFFGYYDLQQISPDKTKLLITEVNKKANTKRDMATLEWYDLRTGVFHIIGTTKAWCWQQGARLRWHPTKNNVVVYNDIKDDAYVTKFYDISLNKETGSLPCAIYDITPDGKYGFSLNYSRLQRLRPGYGYDKLPDQTVNEKIPEMEGITRIDCETKERTLIVTLKELAMLTPTAQKQWNYINHICVSPKGDKIMFFYIWTDSPFSDWKVKLFVVNIDGTELKCLEDNLIPSHYSWRNEQEILIVTAKRNKTCSHYYLYNIINGKKALLPSSELKENGHPSFIENKNEFVSDTYPLKDNMQYLFFGSVYHEPTHKICALYSDPRMFGEKRCDLHPRITPDNTIITVDSTFKNGRRCILIFHKKIDIDDEKFT